MTRASDACRGHFIARPSRSDRRCYTQHDVGKREWRPGGATRALTSSAAERRTPCYPLVIGEILGGSACPLISQLAASAQSHGYASSAPHLLAPRRSRFSDIVGINIA